VLGQARFAGVIRESGFPLGDCHLMDALAGLSPTSLIVTEEYTAYWATAKFGIVEKALQFVEERRWAILDRHLGRPAIQADLRVRGGASADHLQALITTARRRALEPIMLEDVEVEITATAPSIT